MNIISWGIFGLFAGTFVSATLIPFPSEALVISFYELGYGFWAVLLVASIGNFLGSLTNYWIGYKSNTAALKKRFKIKDEKITRWGKRFDKWGIWLGLFSWLPFIGDPMVAVLGFFKVKFIPLSILIFIGKFGRYFLLLYFYSIVFNPY